MNYKVAVFDMDGTILNTIDDLHTSVNFALEKNGLPLRTLKEVLSFVGNGIPTLIERAVQKDTDEGTRSRVYEDFTVYYKDHCHDKTCVYGGIASLIESLRAAGVKTAVVSNKDDYAVKSLVDEYFSGLFDFSLGRRDGVRKKPAPDMVEEALSALGFDKSDAVYIGDSEVDLMTAKNSGLPCIAVTWGFKTKEFLIESGAKVLVDDPKEIYPLIVG